MGETGIANQFETKLQTVEITVGTVAESHDGVRLNFSSIAPTGSTGVDGGRPCNEAANAMTATVRIDAGDYDCRPLGCQVGNL